MSPLLFNIALSKALRVLGERTESGSFVFEELFATMFADDLLVQEEPRTVIRALEALVLPLAAAGLDIKVLPHCSAAALACAMVISDSELSELLPAKCLTFDIHSTRLPFQRGSLPDCPSSTFLWACTSSCLGK